MQMRFYPVMKKLGKRSSFIACFLFSVCVPSFAMAGDVPIERDFLRLPDQRWIWLEKVGWHSTRIVLGKGNKSYKNKIWSQVYETDGERHTWEYAFFIRMKPKQFVIYDSEKNPQVAISTYDMGNGVIRWAIIYRVKNDRLEKVQEIDGFNTAGDGSLFK